MTRGKQAARAANRRAESAHEVIDRLTDQLAEAKLRARQHERAAERLPMVEAEVARLRRLNEDGTSDELVALRTRAEGDRIAATARYEELRQCVGRILARLPSDTPCIARDEMPLYGDLGLVEFMAGTGEVRPTRKMRRAISNRTAVIGKGPMQDNRRSADDNADHAFAGELGMMPSGAWTKPTEETP